MEFKGTNGKWQVRPTEAKNTDGTPLFYDITIDSNHFISTFRNDSLRIDNLKDKANAQLISKAPEMLEEHIKDLELLQKVANQLDELGGFLWDDVMERIAVKKQLIQEATKID